MKLFHSFKLLKQKMLQLAALLHKHWNIIFLQLHLIYHFLVKKTVTVGINWINYCSLLPSLSLCLSLCVPWSQLTAHVGKKSNHSFGLHNPPAEPQTAALARSSPDSAEHPQSFPAPGLPSSARWPSPSLPLNHVEDGKDDLGGGKLFAVQRICLRYIHVDLRI